MATIIRQQLHLELPDSHNDDDVDDDVDDVDDLVDDVDDVDNIDDDNGIDDSDICQATTTC